MKRDFIVRENQLSKNSDVNAALDEPTLEKAIARLRQVLAGYFFYRGGSHYAIHATTQTARIIMLEMKG